MTSAGCFLVSVKESLQPAFLRALLYVAFKSKAKTLLGIIFDPALNPLASGLLYSLVHDVESRHIVLNTKLPIISSSIVLKTGLVTACHRGQSSPGWRKLSGSSQGVPAAHGLVATARHFWGVGAPGVTECGEAAEGWGRRTSQQSAQVSRTHSTPQQQPLCGRAAQGQPGVPQV
ncbi:hypothetical protein GGTG_00793 [Gaeumannomyces tritici R3-111a-1]|uniref:Uncharacterized protein n=1 Tax=Gaeumannomyces tritici (strain R3-111a-1) TaxID=644352 RepID=J3NHQ6_GAET3|nr:hypothetical protein GGTG_00793 [Gaeumannomyces tritici R3-111a-1]EJT80799.1 hypothetical protein GGTG_00793 [Gaeumannomyces tritici R3-111a-1]